MTNVCSVPPILPNIVTSGSKKWPKRKLKASKSTNQWVTATSIIHTASGKNPAINILLIVNMLVTHLELLSTMQICNNVILSSCSSVVVFGQNQPDQSGQTEIQLQAAPRYSEEVCFSLKNTHVSPSSLFVIFWRCITTATKLWIELSREVQFSLQPESIQLKCPWRSLLIRSSCAALIYRLKSLELASVTSHWLPKRHFDWGHFSLT